MNLILIASFIYLLLDVTIAQFNPGACYPYIEAHPLVKDGLNPFFNFERGTLISYLGDAKNFPAASFPAVESAFNMGFKMVATRVCGARDIGGVLVQNQLSDVVIENMERNNIYDLDSELLSQQIYKLQRVIGGQVFTYPEIKLSTYSHIRQLIRTYTDRFLLIEVLPLDPPTMDLNLRIILRKNVEELFNFLNALDAWNNVGIFYSNNFPLLLMRDRKGCDILYGKRYIPTFLEANPDDQKAMALTDGDYATYMRCVEMEMLRNQNFQYYYEFSYTNADLNRLACVGFLAIDYKLFDMQRDSTKVLYPGSLTDIVKTNTYSGTHNMKVILSVDMEVFFESQVAITEKIKSQLETENVDYIMATFDSPDF